MLEGTSTKCLKHIDEIVTPPMCEKQHQHNKNVGVKSMKIG
jgi:hypothetical protein